MSFMAEMPSSSTLSIPLDITIFFPPIMLQLIYVSLGIGRFGSCKYESQVRD